MIAACVSSVNASDYCVGAHTTMAGLLGVPEGLVEDLVADSMHKGYALLIE